MARYRLTIAYDGTDFHGWQRQEPPDVTAPVDPETGERPRVEMRTVQAVVERAVREAVREPVVVIGASRTDAGVHAWHQTAAFTCSDERRGAPEERLVYAINSRLPEDVVVRSCVRTHDEFDPITDCVAKGYRYTVHASPDRPLWDRRYVFYSWNTLDEGAMDEAAKVFVGKHDFAAFAAAGHGRESTVRTVLSCEVRRPAPERVEIHIAADGFLWNMVRIVAGTLVEVGRGRMTTGDVEEALRSGDRRKAGPTLPPEGLCLMWGRYPGDSE